MKREKGNALRRSIEKEKRPEGGNCKDWRKGKGNARKKKKGEGNVWKKRKEKEDV